MENLFDLLEMPTRQLLEKHDIKIFDAVIIKYPEDYKKIIKYINDCFNYRSPYLIEEKSWQLFLIERFSANLLREDLREDIVGMESAEVVQAMAEFLAYQKQPMWETLVAKQNLRMNMIGVTQSFGASVGDKKNANEMITNLDNEITSMFERMKQDQKRFGNYKGAEQLKEAVVRHKINIANWVA